MTQRQQNAYDTAVRLGARKVEHIGAWVWAEWLGIPREEVRAELKRDRNPRLKLGWYWSPRRSAEATAKEHRRTGSNAAVVSVWQWRGRRSVKSTATAEQVKAKYGIVRPVPAEVMAQDESDNYAERLAGVA
jgi:hypothetical protein